MARKRFVPPDHPAFAGLPIQTITARDTPIAVHVQGQLSSRRLPILCIPGFQRNMSDFTEFAAFFRGFDGGRWPAVLLDLPGRGRSGDPQRIADYGAVRAAEDVAGVLAALGIDRAVVLGQGYGGQVAMALSVAHPLLLAGTVLLDAGPVTDARGIVRLRNNMGHVESLRGTKYLTASFRRMLAGDYPGLGDARLEALMGRTHFVDRRGRAKPLYHAKLLEALNSISIDDELEPQWPMFDALRCAPLQLLRTQLTDQLRPQIFREMARRRPDAQALTIAGQGSPALFDQKEEMEAICAFLVGISKQELGKAA
ncbi:MULTISPECIES: alpha/beta hydrolase [unclassified Devosia]|uniref:alpha/beta hydrolase n=1 Tax=unclassified Devosia TaxID=196773 RepID=UPI001552D528|nr:MULTISPECIES: alpha/beta hydrolase [unclassified Devosia]